VYDLPDRAAYLQHYIDRFGYAQFRRLQAKFGYGYPVSYEY